jgi:hypothetical protein
MLDEMIDMARYWELERNISQHADSPALHNEAAKTAWLNLEMRYQTYYVSLHRMSEKGWCHSVIDAMTQIEEVGIDKVDDGDNWQIRYRQLQDEVELQIDRLNALGAIKQNDDCVKEIEMIDTRKRNNV